MNDLSRTIPLPHGAQLIEATTFTMSQFALNDTYAERLIFRLCGKTVQVIRYNLDDAQILVSIEGRVEFIPMSQVNRYIARSI